MNLFGDSGTYFSIELDSFCRNWEMCTQDIKSFVYIHTTVLVIYIFVGLIREYVDQIPKEYRVSVLKTEV